MIADLGPVRLHFVDEGSGPAVVFLHGLAADLDTFAEQARRLGDRYRTIRLDLRGHGGSSTPPGPWTIADIAGDVTALLDHLGIARAHFVGHSAGGVVAVRLAIDHPGRVASLCLVATAAECNEKAANDFYLAWAEIAEREGMGAVLRRMGVKREVEADALGDPLGFARASRAIATLYPEPLTPCLAEIDCPALIVVGDKDWIGAGGSVKASRALRGSELVILPGLGHLPFVQDPDGFAVRLGAFLERATVNR
jgi:pimeloyl-ACP methyl ester carboxylesterase